MGLLSWLLGKPKTANHPTRKAAGWNLSENGNTVLIAGSSKITVFQQNPPNAAAAKNGLGI